MKNNLIIAFSFIIVFLHILYGFLASIITSFLFGNVEEIPIFIGGSNNGDNNNINYKTWSYLMNEIKNFKPIWYATNAVSQTFLIEYKFGTNKLGYDQGIEITEEYVATSDRESIILEWMGMPLKDNSIVLVFLPGLGGNAYSCYITPWYKYCIENNYTGVIVNRRGSHENNRLSREESKFPTIADAQDMIETFKYIRKKSGPDALIVAIGYSAGGNHLVKALYTLETQIINFGISVSCNHDLNNCYRDLKKAWWMNCLFASSYRDIIKKNAHVSRKWIKDHTYITTIDEGIAKSYGFTDVLDYYNQYSTKKEMMDCKIPMLYIMSKDDPLLRGFYDIICHVCSKNPNAFAIVTQRGGHVAWIDCKGEQWIPSVIIKCIEGLKASR